MTQRRNKSTFYDSKKALRGSWGGNSLRIRWTLPWLMRSSGVDEVSQRPFLCATTPINNSNSTPATATTTHVTQGGRDEEDDEEDEDEEERSVSSLWSGLDIVYC